VDTLLRAAGTQRAPWLRLRDQALLALLIYAGLRSQEAVAVQIRDLDLAAGTLTVRRGKGGKRGGSRCTPMPNGS
jgi:integrase